MRKCLILCMLPLACTIIYVPKESARSDVLPLACATSYTPKKSVHWDVFVENQTPDLTVTFIIQIPDGRSERVTVSPGDAIKVSSIEPGSYKFDAYYTLSATYSEGTDTTSANKLLATGSLDVFDDKVFVVSGDHLRFIVKFENQKERAN